MASSDSRTSTASLSPLTMLNTPSGRPASVSSSAKRMVLVGSFSEGFMTKVLPQAIATGNIHMGTMAGKLNGLMPAHTPIGIIWLKLSTPPPTFRLCSPFCRCGIPQANSTTSKPRVNSPLASENTLPCSAVISSANSSACSSTSALNLNIMRARFSGVTLLQVLNASCALAMAARVSSADDRATSLLWLPVAGLKTGAVRPDCEATCWPPM